MTRLIGSVQAAFARQFYISLFVCLLNCPTLVLFTACGIYLSALSNVFIRKKLEFLIIDWALPSAWVLQTQSFYLLLPHIVNKGHCCKWYHTTIHVRIQAIRHCPIEISMIFIKTVIIKPFCCPCALFAEPNKNLIWLSVKYYSDH